MRAILAGAMAMLPYGSGDAFRVGVQKHDRDMERIKRQALSPRQLKLNRYWGFYCTEQYDARSTTWDGRKVLSEIERESIARTQTLPPGFWDPGGQFDEIPLSMRRPTAPYHLTRVVVNRFTGLLFSARMHPQVRIAGSPEMQTWIEGLNKAARIWIRFALVRTRGGAMGSVATTFRFTNGRPVIEVHDSRWCTPTFKDRSTGELTSLEIRYMYPVEERDEKGILHEVLYWYRRVIDENVDILYKPAPVGDGDEPMWVEDQKVAHGLGEFPGVWVRNSQTDEVDGEPDCEGEFEAQEAIDRLLSQADQGAVENCDPSLLLESDELKVKELKKGSRNAIKVERGGGGGYLEMTGAGIEAALKVADVHRRNFLEVVQCVLDNEQGERQMTATEIERRESSMHQRGDLFREQYGEHGAKPMIGKMIRAAIKMRQVGPVDPVTGLRQVGQVKLPPITGDAAGVVAERMLPSDVGDITDDMIELVWPDWIKRGPVDATAASNAVATARTARAVDQESAVNYLAPYFGIDDPAAALERLKSEGGSLDDELMKAMIKAGETPRGAAIAAGAPAPGTGPAGQSPSSTPSTSAPPTHGQPPHHGGDAPEGPGASTPMPSIDNPVQR